MSDLPIRLRPSVAECTEPGDAFHDAAAGAWWLYLPGDNAPTSWPYREPLPNGARWTWDGNETAPTLSPSLHLQCGGGDSHVPLRTIWHGFLRGGRLVD